MKILYVTQSYPPEPGATSKPHYQALLLQRLGHEVTVLTSMPSYPYSRVQEGYRHRAVLTEFMEGVRVVRVWSLPAANRAVVRRSISFVSFAAVAVIAGLLLPRHELIIATVPRPLTDAAGLLIGRLKRTRVVLELCDILPDSLIAVGRSPSSIAVRAAEAYCRWLFRRMTVIAVCGEWMIPRLGTMGIREERTVRLFHGTESALIDAADPDVIRKRLRLEGAFVAIYAGSFSAHYDVPNLVSAARILKEKRPSFRLLLLGTGVDASRVATMVSDERLDNVIVLGAVPQREVFPYLKAADLCLAPCVYRSSWIHDYITTKPCEYLMAGKPILAIEDHPLLGDVLSKARAGRIAPTGNPEALAREIEYFMDHPDQTLLYGHNGREFAWQYLRREEIVPAFDEALKERLSALRT